jgi:hypothetical protein
MSCIAWVMVWHGVLVPMPQQAESMPVTPSTLMVVNAAQQVELLVSQKPPPAQLEESMQLVRQAPTPQTKGVQSVVPGGGQLPAPSQTVASVWVVPLQLAPGPHETVLSGKVQAPVVSQSVAPQGAVVLAHAVVQQWPVPATPQTPDWQTSLTVQADPSASGATQLLPEQTNPVSQSVDMVQLARQVMASAQMRLPGQGAGVCAAQVPLLSQALVVRVLPVQASVPQAVPEG